MFRNISVLEVKAGDERMHRYECAPNAPLGEIHDSLCAMKAYILSQMKEKEEKEREENQKCKEEKAKV